MYVAQTVQSVLPTYIYILCVFLHLYVHNQLSLGYESTQLVYHAASGLVCASKLTVTATDLNRID